MRKIPFTLTLFFLVVTGQAQPVSKLDSLLTALTSAREDTNKVRLLLRIEKQFLTTDPDSALYYNKECEKLISKIGSEEYKHTCFHEFVKIYHAKRDFNNALDYCLKSIAVAKHNKNRFQEATSYRAIFNIYHNLNMSDSAVKYAIHSIGLTIEIADTSNISVNYGNLCWLYLEMAQYGKAIEYGHKGIASGERYADTVGLLVSINNVALCHLRTNNYEAAIVLLKRQYEIGKRVNRTRSIRNALINLGEAYYYTGNAAGLEETAASLNAYNAREAVLDANNGCQQHIINAYSDIFQKKFLAAEEHLLAAVKIAETDSLINTLVTIYTTLSKVKYAQHDFTAGNFYEGKASELSLTDEDQRLSEYAKELETKYEVEKKSAKIALQEAQIREKSILNYLLVGAGLGLLIISLLAYRTYIQRHKIQQQRIIELETEKQLTATEAVLKGEEQERTRLAKDLHDGLGGMLSGIKYSFNAMKGNLIMTPENHQAFERSMDMLDGSIKEMRRVAHNMMPEALVKFGLDTALKDFCNDINQSGALQVSYQSIDLAGTNIEQTTAITIYRIIQELISNAMKHASAKKVIVQVAKSHGQLAVTVEDDGKGFDTTMLSQSKGIGWTNIQHRVDFLKGKVDINSQSGKGTSVYIEFGI
jgi:signal transduction histidine kinase